MSNSVLFLFYSCCPHAYCKRENSCKSSTFPRTILKVIIFSRGEIVLVLSEDSPIKSFTAIIITTFTWDNLEVAQYCVSVLERAVQHLCVVTTSDTAQLAQLGQDAFSVRNNTQVYRGHTLAYTHANVSSIAVSVSAPLTRSQCVQSTHLFEIYYVVNEPINWQHIEHLFRLFSCSGMGPVWSSALST